MFLNNDIYVIVTAYNESKYLAYFLKNLKQVTTNIVVVDDGSTDQSLKIANQYSSFVLHHLVNLGKGAAMKTGADFAFNKFKAKAVIFMDGDGQHDPQDLPAFFDLLKKTKFSTQIFGVRDLDRGMPKHRSLGNRFITFLVKVFFGQEIPDILSGFKAMGKKHYQQLRWTSSNYGVELEIACRTAKNHLPFAVLPIKTIYHDMDRGMNWPDALKIVYQVLLWRINL